MDYRSGLVQHIRKQRVEGKGITACQRTVLQRRKAHIAAEVEDLATQLILGLHQRQIIDEDMLTAIKEEKSGSGQVLLLLEVITLSPHAIALDVFLELIHGPHPHLVAEIRTDIRYEEGAAGVPDNVAKEAGTLVHRKFGSSKRWGEGDKKNIIDLLAVKMQLLNEEWESHNEVTESSRAKLALVIKNKEYITSTISKQLLEFTKVNHRKLTTHSHDMSTTSQHLADVFDNPKKDSLQRLQEGSDVFLKNIDRILCHRDGLIDERLACLAKLGVKDDRKNLERAITQKLAIQEQLLKDANSDSARNTTDTSIDIHKYAEDIKNLNKRLTNMEDLLIEKDEIIENLKKQLNGSSQ